MGTVLGSQVRGSETIFSDANPFLTLVSDPDPDLDLIPVSFQEAYRYYLPNSCLYLSSKKSLLKTRAVIKCNVTLVGKKD